MAERKTIKEIKELLLKNRESILSAEVQGIALGPIETYERHCEFYIKDETGLLYVFVGDTVDSTDGRKILVSINASAQGKIPIKLEGIVHYSRGIHDELEENSFPAMSLDSLTIEDYKFP